MNSRSVVDYAESSCHHRSYKKPTAQKDTLHRDCRITGTAGTIPHGVAVLSTHVTPPPQLTVSNTQPISEWKYRFTNFMGNLGPHPQQSKCFHIEFN